MSDDDDDEFNLANIAEEVKRNNGAICRIEDGALHIEFLDPEQAGETLYVQLSRALDSIGTDTPVVFVEHRGRDSQYMSGAVLRNWDLDTVFAIIVAMLRVT